MKHLLIFSLFLFAAGTTLCAQPDQEQLEALRPDSVFDNIHIQRLSGDSLSTAFIIWVKSHVPLHYHAHHSENIYVLSGKGRMRIGELTTVIRTGDHVFVPKTTPHGVVVQSDTPLKVLSIQSPHFDGTDRVMLE